jgi:hypothetical protein
VSRFSIFSIIPCRIKELGRAVRLPEFRLNPEESDRSVGQFVLARFVRRGGVMLMEESEVESSSNISVNRLYIHSQLLSR